MGCDIHLNVEKYGPRSKKWKCLSDPIRKCFVCDGLGRERFAVGGAVPCRLCGGTGKRREPYYWSRNYDVFSMLANVRNGHGIVPIAAPRGLPKNASKRVRHRSRSWGDDGHSHSWFYLSELLGDYWNKTTVHHGFVPLDSYASWKASGNALPDRWAAGVGGGIISEDEAAVMLADKEADAIRRLGNEQPGQIHVYAVWSVAYRDSAARFLQVVQELRALVKNPKHLRIVFWFDN